MSLTLQQNIHFGLGFSSLPDAFQSGREAAQMAKSQLPDGPADLVVVLGPDSVYFQDFIEGVRLITGEDQLLGLPAKKIYSTETPGSDVYYVILFRSPTTHLSLTFTDGAEKDSVLTTALISQLRQIRGNASFEEPFGGLLVVNRLEGDAQTKFVERISMELGFKSDLICLTPLISPQSSFIVRSRNVAQGMVALEYLSPLRWGMGSVDIQSFDGKKPGFHAEAAKSAVRDSLAQLKGHTPAAGFIFFDAKLDSGRDDAHEILNGAAALLPHVPLLAVPTSQQFVRCAGRSTVAQPQSIVSLLVPR